jgi:hypothetical protein
MGSSLIATGEQVYAKRFVGERFDLADGRGDLIWGEVGGSEGAETAGVGDGGD